MNSTHTTKIDWSGIRLLLRDYLQRRWQRMLVMVAVYLFGAVAWTFDNQPGRNLLLFLFLFTLGTDLPNSSRNAHHPDANVIRSLPVTEKDAVLATWLQYFGVPLFLCIGSGMMAFLAGVFAFGSPPLAVGRFAVYVSVVAMFQSLSVGISGPVMWLSMSVTNVKWKPWATVAAVLASSLGAMVLPVGVMLWVMRETNTARLVGIAAPAAVLLLGSSFHFRRYLVVDPRATRSAALAQPSATKRAAFAPRRWQDRCYPLLAAARVGAVLAAVSGAVALGLSLQSKGAPADAGAGTGLFIILLVIISVIGGMRVMLPWLSTMRACRALPISRERLVFGAVALQLLTALPGLLVLCGGAWLFSPKNGAAVWAPSTVWTGLTVEALVLFVYPYAVRSGGEQYMQLIMLAILFHVNVTMFFRTFLPELLTAPMLQAFALPMLAVSLLFCCLRLRAFIANESRMYQKHASALFGQEM